MHFSQEGHLSISNLVNKSWLTKMPRNTLNTTAATMIEKSPLIFDQWNKNIFKSNAIQYCLAMAILKFDDQPDETVNQRHTQGFIYKIFWISGQHTKFIAICRTNNRILCKHSREYMCVASTNSFCITRNLQVAQRKVGN